MISNVCIIEVVNSSFWGLHDNRFLKNLQNNKLIFLSLGTLHTHSIINVQTCICIYQQVKIDRYNDRKKQRLCIILWVGVQKHKIPSACSNRSCSRGRHCWTVLPLLSIEQNKQAFKTFWQVLFKLKAKREKKGQKRLLFLRFMANRLVSFGARKTTSKEKINFLPLLHRLLYQL